MKKLSKWIILSGLIFFSLWLPGFYRRATHGFRLAKCEFDWPAVVQWEVDVFSLKNEAEILGILQQPFTYLAKGAQSYAFLSKDGHFVLKLFHFYHSRIPIGKNLKNQWKKWVKGREVEKFSFEESVLQTLGSYKLAYDLAPDLTGLVYVHLNTKKTPLPIIRIQDRMRRSYGIDPAKYRFILQKRGDPFLQSFNEAASLGSIDGLAEACYSLFKKLGDLGLFNRDPSICRNFAFIDGQAILTDAGSLSYQPESSQENSILFRNSLEALLKKRFASFHQRDDL